MGLHTTNPPPTSPTHGPNRYNTLPATAAPWPDRYKTLPARPKTPKSGHFKRAGRISSRFHHHATEQGELSPASNTNPPLTRYKTLPATATPWPNRYKTLPATATPGPNRYKTLPARPKTPKSGHFKHAGRISSRFQHHATEQGEFSPASNTTPPSRENFLPLPTPIHHSPGTKLSPQQPPPGPTGTKLSQQHPPPGPTGTKLSQHAQKHRNPAISREQGEFSPGSTTTPPSRENFLPVPPPPWCLFQRS